MLMLNWKHGHFTLGQGTPKLIWSKDPLLFVLYEALFYMKLDLVTHISQNKPSFHDPPHDGLTHTVSQVCLVPAGIVTASLNCPLISLTSKDQDIISRTHYYSEQRGCIY